MNTPGRRVLALSDQPSGYTLVELLVVIGIILLLMAVSTYVIGNVLQSARIRATEATIAKINGLLQERMEAFARQMEKQANTGRGLDVTNPLALLRGVEQGNLQAAITLLKRPDFRQALFSPEIDWTVLDAANERTWEVLGKKLCFRAKFPTSFLEVAGWNGKPGDPSTGTLRTSTPPLQAHVFPDPSQFGQYGGTDELNRDDIEPYASLIRERMQHPDKHLAETESAELLYLILTEADILGASPVSVDEFSSSEVRDTDGDGLLEFVDGWGRPLRFYRWPTRLLVCGDDGPNTPLGDTNGDSQRTMPGPAQRGSSNYDDSTRGVPDPRLANLVISNLPSLRPDDESLKRDPGDPFNLIYHQIIQRNTQRSAPTSDPRWNARLKLEQLYHTPEIWHTPLILSAGPDGQLGLYEPCQWSPYDQLNIYGHLAQPARDHTRPPSDSVNVLGDLSTHPLSDNISNRRK